MGARRLRERLCRFIACGEGAGNLRGGVARGCEQSVDLGERDRLCRRPGRRRRRAQPLSRGKVVRLLLGGLRIDEGRIGAHERIDRGFEGALGRFDVRKRLPVARMRFAERGDEPVQAIALAVRALEVRLSGLRLRACFVSCCDGELVLGASRRRGPRRRRSHALPPPSRHPRRRRGRLGVGQRLRRFVEGVLRASATPFESA